MPQKRPDAWRSVVVPVLVLAHRTGARALAFRRLLPCAVHATTQLTRSEVADFEISELVVAY